MNERLPPTASETEEADISAGLLPGLIRRRWIFFGPLFTIGLLGYIVSNVVSLQYKSSAFIIVEQRTIPDQYVLPNVLMTLQKRLDAMTQQILSRTRLQRFIEDDNLYQDERKTKSIDDIIDTMQKRISVELVQPTGAKNDVTGFHIYFSDRNPYVAQRVTNELTSLFIEQDARERTTQSQGTTAFLESQLEQARKQLADQEDKMRKYKLAHLGELPDQEQTNVRILTSLDAQLQASTTALDRAEQQRIYLEALQSQQRAFDTLGTPPLTVGGAASAVTAPGTEPSNQTAQTISFEAARSTLANLYQQLRALSAKFTDQHPEIVRLKKEIADWEATVDRLNKQRAADVEIASRLKSVIAEIQSERRQGTELRARISRVQTQLSQTPVREQEMAELNRSYENAKANVRSLLEKKQSSELASNLEERQGGERFRLLDPATLPKKAEGRTKIVMAGWAVGLVLGAGLVFLLEMLDSTVHKPADLQALEWVPVLARIPKFRTDREQKRRRLRLKFEVVAVAVLVVVALASGTHTYLQG